MAHALLLRRAVFFGPPAPSAMELAVDDPALAMELRVGRPDLRRDHDDGGVDEVNHALPRSRPPCRG